MYQKYIKRVLDIILSLISLILSLPVIVGIMIAIKLEHNGPIFYTQERTGLSEKRFKIIKFRSMVFTQDLPELKPMYHVTKVGKVIRNTSLDELPQLINILKGDMSIVGPRPLPTMYDPFYTDKHRTRFTVRPGLTGLSQVNGRGTLPILKTLEYDQKYVSHITFTQDASIFFKTFHVLLCKQNSVAVKERERAHIESLKVEKQKELKLIKQQNIHHN